MEQRFCWSSSYGHSANSLHATGEKLRPGTAFVVDCAATFKRDATGPCRILFVAASAAPRQWLRRTFVRRQAFWVRAAILTAAQGGKGGKGANR